MADLRAVADEALWLASKDKQPVPIDGDSRGFNKDPAKWSTLADVRAFIRRNKALTGLTIMLTALPGHPDTRLCALDTDHCYESAEDESVEAWAGPVHALLDGHLTERSTSGTGRHHYFLICGGTIPDHIVDHNYVKGKGEARHGFELRGVSKTNWIAVSEIAVEGDLQTLTPDALTELVSALEEFAPKPKPTPVEVPLQHPRRWRERDDDVPKAFEILDNLTNDYDWQGWFTIGAAVHNVTGGSEEGYRAFADFTSKGGYATAKDLKACRETWGQFRRNHPLADMGHLVNEARQHGYEPYPKKKQPNGDDGFHDAEPEAVEWDDIGRTMATPASSLLDLGTASARRFADQPFAPIDFLVAKLFPHGMVSLISADSGAGKSILMQTLCTCVATVGSDGLGLPFLGLRTMGGVAVFLTKEDKEKGLRNRQHRIMRELNLPWDDLGDRLLLRTMPRRVWFWKDGQPTGQLTKAIAELRDLTDLRVVVIDSNSLIFADREIERYPVVDFMSYLADIADELNIAIILIAHTSRSSRADTKSMTSGSTGWVAQARSGIMLHSDNDELGGKELKLTLINSNWAEPGFTMNLIWTDNGVLIAKDPPGQVERIENENLQKHIRDGVARGWANRAPVTLNTRSINEGRYLPAILKQLHGCRPGDVLREAKAMLSRGELIHDAGNSKRRAGLKLADNKI